MRGERVRENYDDYDHHRNRDNDRHCEFKDRRPRHRSRSKDKSRNRSRSVSSSHSPSKSKQKSGFDMEPPVASILSGAAVPEQLPGVPQTMQGMVQSIRPFGATQLGALPMMPVEAMTQQATRHAHRLYVGGLSPLANEQVLFSYLLLVLAFSERKTRLVFPIFAKLTIS